MGRSVSTTLSKILPIQNPLTGIFGTGKVEFLIESGTFVVPAHITTLRVRVWGQGGSDAGSGGGFAMKQITVDGNSSIAVTVGKGSNAAGATSSFGSYVSATGGSYRDGSPGTGIGGDINHSGGASSGGNGATYDGGGGAANLLGDGGAGAPGSAGNSSDGFSTGGGYGGAGKGYKTQMENIGVIFTELNLDYIGCGDGGYGGYSGTNGGGGTRAGGGGFPGGAAGGNNIGGGGNGLIIVEY